jgi:heme/copper-type cytochrome/quinol oxidase subunit 2
MAFDPRPDDLSAFEAKETSHTIPLGWSLLFWGLIAWGVYYLWAYSPALGGWQQAQDADGGGAAVGTNTLFTVLFTAIPTAAAVALALTQRARKARPRV